MGPPHLKRSSGAGGVARVNFAALLVMCALAAVWIPALTWLSSNIDWGLIVGALAIAGVVLAGGAVGLAGLCGFAFLMMLIAGTLPPDWGE